MSGFETAPFGPAAGPDWLPGNTPQFIDGPQPDVWSLFFTQSRATPDYAPAKSSVTLVFAPTATNDPVLEPVVSRIVPFYKAPLSRVSMQPDASTNTFADWTPGTIKDPDPARPYAAPRAQTINVWVNPPASTDTVALPTVVASSPLRFYSAPKSQASIVPLDTVFGTEYAPATRSMLPEPAVRPASFVVFAADNPLVSASIAPVITSTPSSFYSPPLSVTISPWLNTVFGTEFAPSTITNPNPPPWSPQHSFVWITPGPPGTPPPVVGDPGGGGYGAVMSDRHFKRYEVAGPWRRVKRVKI